MDAFLPSPSLPPIPLSTAPIPTYTIDLSLPPHLRYVHLATSLSPQMHSITPLFDEILRTSIPSPRIRSWIATLAWLFLRRLYSREETEELRGIAQASGVEMWLLVALNVLLDGMLGCTSGTVMTTPKGIKRGKRGRMGRMGKGVVGEVREKEKRMMHFRTLDWGMDALRSVLVVLEFVRSKSEAPEKVVARSVTYAGFVGVLTGVRGDMSVSLNFRPNHKCSTLSLRIHQLLVLFGFRPSIASVLRNVVLPSPKKAVPSVQEVAVELSQQKTSPCYIILCDGTIGKVLEKDLLDAKIRTSVEFIVHTNNDTSPSPSPAPEIKSKSNSSAISILDEIGMDAFLKDSRKRRACVQKKWDAMKGRQRRKQQVELVEESKMVGPSVREDTLVGWVDKYPTMNGQSHFGCVMDPRSGGVRWIKRGMCWLSRESLMQGEEEEDFVVVSE